MSTTEQQPEREDLFARFEQAFVVGHGAALSGLLDDARFAPKRIRSAAVLVAVTERPQPGILLTHRPATMRDHAGQVAFPGGKIEPGESPVEAALREANEELSIDPAQVRIIGQSDRFVSATGFEITPVLGLVPADLPIVPHPEEVASWFEVPLAYVFDEANRLQKELLYRGNVRPYLEIQWEGHRIWGVTAAILHNLSLRLAWRELLGG